MIGKKELKKLRGAMMSSDPAMLDAAVAELGKPAPAEIVASALTLLGSEDRNDRVLALRIFSKYPCAESREGILRGLGDPERRVREVAAKASKPFLGHPQVAERLRQIVCDEDEKPKIRGAAFGALSLPGQNLEHSELPDAAVAAMEALAKSEQHRWSVLIGLLQMEMSDGVEYLLASFVKEGSKGEAVMATRGLCGYRIVNIGKVQDDELKSRIRKECDIAVGRVFYWVRRKTSAHAQELRL